MFLMDCSDLQSKSQDNVIDAQGGKIETGNTKLA